MEVSRISESMKLSVRRIQPVHAWEIFEFKISAAWLVASCSDKSRKEMEKESFNLWKDPKAIGICAW